MNETKFDLEDRLLEFAVRIIRVSESMHRSRAGAYVGDQLLRAGSSPYGHHGEAESAESRDDFIHKLKVCHKELRETRRWLRLVQRVPLVEHPERLEELLTEARNLSAFLPRAFAPRQTTAGQPARRHHGPGE